MSVSGSRAADEINLDEFERRLRAGGGPAARAEDPLAELARLVESSQLRDLGRGRAVEAASPSSPAPRRGTPRPPLEAEALRPTIDEEVEDLAPGARRRPSATRGRITRSTPIALDDADAAEPGAARRPAGAGRSRFPRWRSRASR